MFTGIVTGIGDIVAIEEKAQGLKRLRIACDYDRGSIAIGASIACSGICLTVVQTTMQNRRTLVDFDMGAETLSVTNAGQWRTGGRVNLERALRLGDELGGHLVAGHVDGLAWITKREDLPDMARFTFEVSPTLARFIASKGSVALDGTSLTVNEVAANAFSVLLIPHTLNVTTWGERRESDALNLEVDTMARYAARLLETRLPPSL